MKVPELNDRVLVDTFYYTGWGTVEFIDKPNLYTNQFMPIQLIIDEPYDKSGQLTYRVNLKDIQEIGTS
ncbi:hypothetical protein [Halobacillus karajensis]|uniref:hypothetical protein n=1 Tax=Halobacillus karajensis TaxID=195088 RepID=UPI00055757D5|nr:hypothetical protein [Halobacillus karajensis]